MRTQFHQQIKDTYRASFGTLMFLKPFSPSDIYTFLTRWPFKANVEQNIARIYSELTDRPTLREMCSNPLVLAMYVAEDQAAGHIMVPESRTEFYQKVTAELILNRRILQKTGPSIAPSKLRQQRESILGKLAYKHMLNAGQPANSLQWADALRVVRDVLKCNTDEAEEHFRELAKETGLVSEERREQSFRFIHLTFCEFLAAFEVVQGQKKGWATLIHTHEAFQNQGEPQLRTRLVEVIPFACGLLPRVDREEALSDVAKLADNGLLARCFLETKCYDHPSWPAFVEQQKRLLLSVPEQNWDDRWLRDLYLFNVVVRDATQCATHMPSLSSQSDFETFFQTLVNKQQASLSKLLTAYAAQDAAAAFRLAEVSHLDLAKDFPEIIVQHCDQEPFMALVREHAAREQDRIGVWATLLAEAALRSEVVARRLAETPPEERWEPIIQTIPKKQSWLRRGITRDSQLIQCFSIAGAASVQGAGESDTIKELRKIPPPGQVWWVTKPARRIMEGIMTVTIAGGGTGIWGIADSLVPRLQSPWVIAMMFLVAVVMFIGRRRQRIYQGIYEGLSEPAIQGRETTDSRLLKMGNNWVPVWLQIAQGSLLVIRRDNTGRNTIKPTLRYKWWEVLSGGGYGAYMNIVIQRWQRRWDDEDRGTKRRG
jgi:hypothetical protein